MDNKIDRHIEILNQMIAHFGDLKFTTSIDENSTFIEYLKFERDSVVYNSLSDELNYFLFCRENNFDYQFACISWLERRRDVVLGGVNV